MAEEYGKSEATATELLASAPASDALGRLYELDGMLRGPSSQVRATVAAARQAAFAQVQKMAAQDAGLTMYLEELRRVHGEKMYLRAVQRLEKQAAEEEHEWHAKVAHIEAQEKRARSGAQGVTYAMGKEGLSGANDGSHLPFGSGTVLSISEGANRVWGADGVAGSVTDGYGDNVSPGRAGQTGAEKRAPAIATVHVETFDVEVEKRERQSWERNDKCWTVTDHVLLHGLPGRVSALRPDTVASPQSQVSSHKSQATSHKPQVTCPT